MATDAPDSGRLLAEVVRHHPGGEAAVRTAIELAMQSFTDHRTADAARNRGMAAAEILAAMRLDPSAIAAAIVVPAVGALVMKLADIEEGLGREVSQLARGVRRLQRIHWDRLEEEKAESLRKMFLALASDVRVVLIALAFHCADMRMLEFLADFERQRLARETMGVFAPLANRLGIWHLKWELEDRAFRELEPETYRQIRDLLAETRDDRNDFVEQVIETLRRELADAAITARITGRPKHIYSIYKKMRRKNVEFERIYDTSAVRVIVDDVRDCYAALGIVHGLWTPIEGEFDDYIAKPKDNYYRSLHTAVEGPGSRPVEIQIRTREMHEFAEYGIAAHWRYKEGKRGGRAIDQQIDFLRQLMEWQKEVTDPRDFVESLRTDIFADQVYVFTPGGDVVDLPVGATPIDFAYRIHTEVGHRCRGAKVNGQIVPLEHHLETGDRVEIITVKTGGPSRDWLNPHLGYIRTSGARQKIRQYFRLQQRETSITQGRELVDRELRRLGLDGRKPDEVARALGYDRSDELFAALGFGDLSTQQIGARLLELERAAAAAPDAPVPLRERESDRSARASGVSLAGVDDVLSQPARCCNPVPGDVVVGYITRGRGMTIHRRDCPNMRTPSEPERVVELAWTPKLGERYPVSLRVVANDRTGLLRDIADVIASEGVNLSSASVSTDKDESLAIVLATLEVRSSEQVVRILSKLERLNYVRAAARVRG